MLFTEIRRLLMKNITKIICALCLACVMLFSLTTSSYAATYPCTGYSTGNSVNVRSGPSTSYPSYGKINYGEPTTVLSLENGWYKISYPPAESDIAYISADYVSLTVPPARSDASVSYGSSSSISAGERVVQIAEQFLGLPYVYGGSTPAGFDCSGFTSYVFKQLGYSLYRSSYQQINNGVPVSKSELQPGDLLLFKKQGASRIHHVGIYVGNGMMIHSPQTGDVIKYTSIVTGYYNNCYYAARRIVR